MARNTIPLGMVMGMCSLRWFVVMALSCANLSWGRLMYELICDCIRGLGDKLMYYVGT